MIDMLKALFRSQTPATQRRAQTRLACRIPVRFTHRGGIYGSILSDIGCGGLQLQTGRALKPGSVVQVYYSGGPQGSIEPLLTMRVAWCRRVADSYVAGLSVNETPTALKRSWLPSLLHSLS